MLTATPLLAVRHLGQFRSLKRGERKRGKLDVVYDYGDGKRIEFSGPEPLGA
ncbi:replication protein C, IncQ-type, partial [Aeromonas caviae]|uniref:replication protein C, IncQ-type n=1 Tax=Aeromonas caviae TaxID=648 RepID=UPI0022A6DC4D